ncbi:hypothetical protein ADUPG1_013904 [Aduncisulcus paluster]|uniref:Uncharacterized protein n=1 Tax=Aduncisulcus paluster TaxID=2918883 RepID=A0ABQ5K4R7_9EUKA|nr:hypothetical protein ADUPG1_013904 [Aduncisulcus paluster]
MESSSNKIAHQQESGKQITGSSKKIDVPKKSEEVDSTSQNTTPSKPLHPRPFGSSWHCRLAKQDTKSSLVAKEAAMKRHSSMQVISPYSSSSKMEASKPPKKDSVFLRLSKAPTSSRVAHIYASDEDRQSRMHQSLPEKLASPATSNSRATLTQQPFVPSSRLSEAFVCPYAADNAKEKLLARRQGVKWEYTEDSYKKYSKEIKKRCERMKKHEEKRREILLSEQDKADKEDHSASPKVLAGASHDQVHVKKPDVHEHDDTDRPNSGKVQPQPHRSGIVSEKMYIKHKRPAAIPSIIGVSSTLPRPASSSLSSSFKLDSKYQSLISTIDSHRELHSLAISKECTEKELREYASERKRLHDRKMKKLLEHQRKHLDMEDGGSNPTDGKFGDDDETRRLDHVAGLTRSQLFRQRTLSPTSADKVKKEIDTFEQSRKEQQRFPFQAEWLTKGQKEQLDAAEKAEHQKSRRIREKSDKFYNYSLEDVEHDLNLATELLSPSSSLAVSLFPHSQSVSHIHSSYAAQHGWNVEYSRIRSSDNPRLSGMRKRVSEKMAKDLECSQPSATALISAGFGVSSPTMDAPSMSLVGALSPHLSSIEEGRDDGSVSVEQQKMQEKLSEEARKREEELIRQEMELQREVQELDAAAASVQERVEYSGSMAGHQQHDTPVYTHGVSQINSALGSPKVKLFSSESSPQQQYQPQQSYAEYDVDKIPPSPSKLSSYFPVQQSVPHQYGVKSSGFLSPDASPSLSYSSKLSMKRRMEGKP